MQRFPQLEEKLAAAGDDAARLEALLDLVTGLARAGNAERAMPLAREAEQLARARGDDNALAVALCGIGACHYLSAEYTRGLEECMRALVAAEHVQNSEAMASALVSAAGCQYQMGAREGALQALYQALESLEATACDRLAIRVHNGLGTILSDKGRFEESEDHFRQALEIGARSNDAVYTPLVKMNYAGMHHERGLVLERAGMKPEAHAHYRAGIQLCEEASVGWGLEAFSRAYRDGMMGELYRELGEVETARLLFGEMLHYATEGANPHQQAEALMNLGKTYMTLGKPAEAREHLERAVDLASIAKVQRLIVNGFLSLAAWHEEAGEIREALDHHKRARALQEELQRAEVHATGTAHQIWIRFQELRREVKSYQEHAELLVRDNGELATRVDRLVRVAHEDALTGLSNRRYLDMRMAEFVAAANENGLRMCVGIVDIDHFKAINDAYSHAAGDAVLRTVASMIGAHCREGDVSARYGGDEFVVCLVGARLEGSLKVLERLRCIVAEHTWTDLPPEMHVTLSIGVTEVDPSDTVATLLHRVDAALYRAKRAGRNCVMG
jgi:diguanylate cyclase (GGDEF)-like protein